MRMYNVCLDEDSNLIIDADEVENYKDRGFVRVGDDGAASIVDIDDTDRMVGLLEGHLVEVGQEQAFYEATDKLKHLCNTVSGVLVNWAIEYDDNLMYIMGNETEILEWLNRPYDESEFPA